MTVLIVGATGATGRLLVKQLLNRGLHVKVIVRSPAKLPEEIRSHGNVAVIQASVLDLSDAEMAQHVKGCDAVASCLGHNISFKGIYGYPRMLVTETTRRLCNAIKTNKPDKPVRFVLVLSYFALAFAISWGVFLLVVGGPGAIPGAGVGQGFHRY